MRHVLPACGIREFRLTQAQPGTESDWLFQLHHSVVGSVGFAECIRILMTQRSCEGTAPRAAEGE